MGLTREKAKEKIWINKKETYPYSIEDNVDEVIDQIFNEHETQIKAKNEENKELSKKCAEIAYDFENSVVEIEKLKTIIEEAIRKPMGVEPHSWSDYKMQKDNK